MFIFIVLSGQRIGPESFLAQSGIDLQSFDTELSEVSLHPFIPHSSTSAPHHPFPGVVQGGGEWGIAVSP